MIRVTGPGPGHHGMAQNAGRFAPTARADRPGRVRLGAHPYLTHEVWHDGRETVTRCVLLFDVRAPTQHARAPGPM